MKSLIIDQSDAINDVRYTGSNVFEVTLRLSLSQQQRDSFRAGLKGSDKIDRVGFIDYSPQ